MKSALVVDCDINPKTLPEYLRPAVKWRKVGRTLTAYLPQGTVFDAALGGDAVVIKDAGGANVSIPHPAYLVLTGQAAAGDDECAAAAGLTPEQSQQAQRLYLSAVAGVKGKNDLDLFMAEVIDGYDTANPNHSDDHPVYKPGKYWNAYAEAMGQQKDGDE